LVVSADAINALDSIPTVYVAQLIEDDPRSLLAVRIEGHGWASALHVERPPRSRLVERTGTATPQEMERFDNALRAASEV
jgi:mRNA-degrading endonuclease toxin of MazEF toxin-antitoxin module